MRSDWTALPATVTAHIAERVGGPFDVTVAPAGNHAEIAASVTGPAGRVFVKAASGGISGQSLRYELAAMRGVEQYPPAVLWHVESGDWLVVGVEQLDGAHADLSPGSPDLDLLAVALKGLQEAPAPPGVWLTAAGRCGFTHPAMAGRMFVHTDLNPSNVIVTAGGLRIVDWAFATKAAPWVELAFLAQWLIGSGHSPEQAQQWLAQFPAWATADSSALDHFAASNAAKWSSKAQASTIGWVRDLAAWTGQWAAYRRR